MYLAWFVSLPKFDDPNFWEALLEANPMMGFVRLSIMAGAIYVVISVIALTSRGQWLSRAGPFQVQGSVDELSDAAVTLRGQLEDAGRTMGDLRAELVRLHMEMLRGGSILHREEEGR